jgi:hypothetical protein
MSNGTVGLIPACFVHEICAIVVSRNPTIKVKPPEIGDLKLKDVDAVVAK